MSQQIPFPPTSEAAALDRRSFLRQSGLTVGALVSGLLSFREKANARVEGPETSCPRFGVFGDHTFATLETFAEQIVPADQDPGATDLCSASLVEAIASGDPATVTLITDGLAALDEACHILFGLDFKDLELEEQTEALVLMEAGSLPGSSWQQSSVRNLKRLPEASLSREAAGMVRHLERWAPAKLPMGGALSDGMASSAQQALFASLRTFSKLAFVLNFPENVVRNDDGTPIFADPAHLISDPDDPSTVTGWTIVDYHEIDYEVEKLMWEWQAGYRVVGFDGIPILDQDNPLSEDERLSARDALYALSDRGLA